MLDSLEETFALLFDKNNNTAYKALQGLQKESEESDKIYCYMDKLADISIYADSMQSLVHKDIQNSLAEIEKI